MLRNFPPHGTSSIPTENTFVHKCFYILYRTYRDIFLTLHFYSVLLSHISSTKNYLESMFSAPYETFLA